MCSPNCCHCATKYVLCYRLQQHVAKIHVFERLRKCRCEIPGKFLSGSLAMCYQVHPVSRWLCMPVPPKDTVTDQPNQSACVTVKKEVGMLLFVNYFM